MNIALWIVQALLALAFGMAGALKLSAPIDELLANGMTFVSYTPATLVRLIGLAEFAGAVGLIIPAATRIAPKLTPLAAALLGVIMAGAVVVHLTQGEAAMVGGPIVLGALSAFVAWGRTTKHPVAPRAQAAQTPA